MFAKVLIVFCELTSGDASPLKVLVSIVVCAVFVIVLEPITSTFVPSESDSLSDISILYMVIRQVPAVPFAPLNLALPPLMSAVNVAKGVVEAFEIIVLYSVMNAFVPSCINSTSVDETSFEVVLLIDMKYFAALALDIEKLSRVAVAESRSAVTLVAASPDAACEPDESLSPSPILKNETALSVDTDESASRPALPVSLTLPTAALTSVSSKGSLSPTDVLTICDEPENESNVEPSSVPCANMCF